MKRRSSRKSSCGFTLVELLGVLSLPLLFVGVHAGAKLDLIDLVEPDSYLKANDVDTESNALIGILVDHEAKSGDEKALPKFAKEAREHAFLLQVICRELGNRREQKAVTAIKRLTENPDYFIAKHAQEALAMIENGELRKPRFEISDEVKELLPEGTKVGIAFPDNPRANIQRVAGGLPPDVRQQMTAAAVSTVGNVEIGRSVVLYDIGEGLDKSVAIVLIEGHFYQDAMVELLDQAQAMPTVSTEKEWGGIVIVPGYGVPLAVAVVEGRCIAISIVSDSVDEAKLLKIAKAFVNED